MGERQAVAERAAAQQARIGGPVEGAEYLEITGLVHAGHATRARTLPREAADEKRKNGQWSRPASPAD
ncbi:hypothetical protein RVB2_11130 [Pseudomonas aeruginosa]|nr:hypothetical protein RVB2_11130 [Pseudomonas aeruginosa]